MKREGYTISDCSDLYDFSHKKWSSRLGKKPTRIIPHHMAGNLTPKAFNHIIHGNRSMSATVAVFNDGTVITYVPEEMRPWTTGSFEADGSALTLEIANSSNVDPMWPISKEAYNAAVKVMARWCIQYDIEPTYSYRGKGINMHKDWASTACPGPWMERKIKSGELEADIRAEMRKLIINPNAEKFVSVAYKNVLNRAADKAGLNYWATALSQGKKSCKDVVVGLFNSDEYKKQKKDDFQFVMDAYKGFLQRAHDFNGYTYWCSQMSEKGKTRVDVMNGISNSKEFKNLVKKLGLK